MGDVPPFSHPDSGPNLHQQSSDERYVRYVARFYEAFAISTFARLYSDLTLNTHITWIFNHHTHHISSYLITHRIHGAAIYQCMVENGSHQQKTQSCYHGSVMGHSLLIISHPKIMVSKGNHPKMAQQFRLVKYYFIYPDSLPGVGKCLIKWEYWTSPEKIAI